MHVDRPLGPARRARRVHDHQRVLGVERLRLDRGPTRSTSSAQARSRPAVMGCRGVRDAVPHQHVPDRVGAVDRSIGHVLHRVPARPRRKETFAVMITRLPGVGDLRRRRRPNPLKIGTEYRADLGAGHQGRDRLDRHRHEDRDGVTASDAESRSGSVATPSTIRAGRRRSLSGRRRPRPPRSARRRGIAVSPTDRRTEWRRLCFRPGTTLPTRGRG